MQSEKPKRVREKPEEKLIRLTQIEIPGAGLFDCGH